MQTRWRKIRFVVLPVAAALALAGGPVMSAAYAQSLARAAQAQKARSAQVSPARATDGPRPADQQPGPKAPERKISASAVVLAAPKTSKPATMTTTHLAWGQDGFHWGSGPRPAGLVPLIEASSPVTPHRPAYQANAPPASSPHNG